jgi:glycosyltransferase involved in cell wall biosynthesis
MRLTEPRLRLDVSRILWRGARRAPGGVDRLEALFADHLLREAPETGFVFTDGGAVRLLPRRVAAALVRRALARWAGREGDAGCRRVAAYLAGEPGGLPALRLRAGEGGVSLAERLSWTWSELRWQPRRAPALGTEALRGAVYVNLSHRNLDDPRLIAALAPARARLAHVHDDIPLRRPDYAVPAVREAFLRMFAHLTAGGFAITTNSRHSGELLAEAAAARGLALPSPVPMPLPLAPSLCAPLEVARPARPFFVTAGLFTRRKNLATVLEAARLLALRARFDLVLVGAPGADAAVALAGAEGASWLRRASGLSDAAMRPLIASAAAVLAPSIEEGFDYPPQEALALGTPVLASDTAVHREYLEGHARLLPPHAPEAWAEAMGGMLEEAAQREARALARAWPAPTAEARCAALLAFARGLGAQGGGLGSAAG